MSTKRKELAWADIWPEIFGFATKTDRDRQLERKEILLKAVDACVKGARITQPAPALIAGISAALITPGVKKYDESLNPFQLRTNEQSAFRAGFMIALKHCRVTKKIRKAMAELEGDA